MKVKWNSKIGSTFLDFRKERKERNENKMVFEDGFDDFMILEFRNERNESKMEFTDGFDTS